MQRQNIVIDSKLHRKPFVNTRANYPYDRYDKSRDCNLLCIICSIVFSKIPLSLPRLHPNYSMPPGQPISTIIG